MNNKERAEIKVTSNFPGKFFSPDPDDKPENGLVKKNGKNGKKTDKK